MAAFYHGLQMQLVVYMEEAVRLAVQFIARGIGDARRENTPCNDGINYEPYLGLLAPSLPHDSQVERKDT